jgi:hypothetical protein
MSEAMEHAMPAATTMAAVLWVTLVKARMDRDRM